SSASRAITNNSSSSKTPPATPSPNRHSPKKKIPSPLNCLHPLLHINLASPRWSPRPLSSRRRVPGSPSSSSASNTSPPATTTSSSSPPSSSSAKTSKKPPASSPSSPSHIPSRYRRPRCTSSDSPRAT